MIRITDMTLSCLDEYDPDPKHLARLLELLIEIKVDCLELTPAVLKKLGTPDPRGRYILRIRTPDEAEEYPEFWRFICRKSGIPAGESIISDLQVNDMREAYLIERGTGSDCVRVTGLDDTLLHDASLTFHMLRTRLPGRIEFCPENLYGCATALAVEWIISGGTDIAASFGGIGNKAPLEEVLMALRLSARHRPTNTFTVFPEIKRLIEIITGMNFPNNKAVIGENIFAVESGIHVDGIFKRHQIYEPFMPELVGNERRVVIGKHSGLKAVSLKLNQANLSPDCYSIPELLEAVKAMSICRRRSLSDFEFYNLAHFFKTER